MDDFPVIVTNPDIQSISSFLANNRPDRPLREITFLIDHAFFELNPRGYHIQQIFWHCLNAFLIFSIAFRMSGTKAVAWITALLFLVHPVQVEVVAQVSHRKESLALAFSLLSLLAYMRSFEVRRHKILWIAAAIALTLTANLAKETAMVLPFIFLAYEATFIPGKERILLKYPALVLLVLIISAVVCALWLQSIGGIETIRAKMHLSLIVHAGHLTQSELQTWYPMIFKSWIFMVLKLLFPHDLAIEYVYPMPDSWWNPWVISAIFVVLLYVLSLYFAYRRYPIAFFALVWFAAFYIPASNLLPLSYFAADRYLYIPSFGFFLLLGLFFNYLFSKFRIASLTSFLLIIAILSVLTWKQNQIWQSTLTLYSNAVRVSPASAFALSNLGWEYYHRYDIKRSLSLLKKATEVNPYLPMPYYNLASIYEFFGDKEKALYYYFKSLSFSHYMPGFFEPTAQSIRKKLREQYGIMPDQVNANIFTE
ncbi:MAG: hypothetical protein JSU90_00445 [Nitrospiraceae bacterium]|nr:MAG: hypothetical protein JSU90_00445 [Nitrospiraceae bacterium]